MKINILLIALIFSTTTFAQIADQAEGISPLLIGEKVPATEIESINNQKTTLIDLAKNKPTVLLFYRGGWCPYCNAHLAAVGEITDEINKLGYQIVGISPDAPQKLAESLDKQNLSYQLFSDASGALIQAMGIAHKAPEEYGTMLLDFSDGANKGFLPVPSLFILDQEGTIVFEYISPDYKQRISATMLLAVLKALNEEGS
ncbi:MAG: peroxiredoxin-like family protein [Flavobacteriaceae bacterium]